MPTFIEPNNSNFDETGMEMVGCGQENGLTWTRYTDHVQDFLVVFNPETQEESIEIIDHL